MRHLVPLLAVAWGLGHIPLASDEVRAQEIRRGTVGFSTGAGAVQTRSGGDAWDFGPIFGGRAVWGTRRYAGALTLEAQPFQAKGNTQGREFRAIYVLPSFVIGGGARGRQIGIGVGFGVFHLAEWRIPGSSAPGETEVGWVAGAAGSQRLHPDYRVELGWKRIENVKGLRANVWTLQLVRSWGF